MNKLIRSVLAACAVVPLIAGSASAGIISGGAFHGASPADTAVLANDGTQIFNTSQTTTVSVMADAGIVHVPNVIFSLPGATVRVDENNTAVRVVCYMTATDVRSGQTFMSGPGQAAATIGLQDVVIPGIHIPGIRSDYALGVLCAIPPLGSHGLTSIFSVSR
jgi:hypothetical protein